MAVTVAAGHLDKAIYLAVGKILARANLDVALARGRAPSTSNCPEKQRAN